MLYLALGTVWFVWGSTYLGIRWAIETIPGFLMAGVRFVIAGSLMYAWARWRGAAPPTPKQWRAALVVGSLMLLGGNGAVVWAEQFVPSGLTALVVATEPLWVVLLDWAHTRGNRPTAGEIVGLLLGFAGAALLIGPGDPGQAHVHPIGALVLMGGTVCWATGSILSRSADLPPSPLMRAAMTLIGGGLGLLIAATLTGEWQALDLDAISARSAWSFLYLMVFGAIVGYTAYLWTLRQTTLAIASTYAYVNPLVAVALGWALAGERVTFRVLLAAGVIVSSVVIITTARTAAVRAVGSAFRRAGSWASRR